MNSPEPRTCGVCLSLLRPGTFLMGLRLTDADMVGKKNPADKKPGLRHACPDCVTEYASVVHRRVANARFEEMVRDLAMRKLDDHLDATPGQFPDMKTLFHEAEDSLHAMNVTPDSIMATLGNEDLV